MTMTLSLKRKLDDLVGTPALWIVGLAAQVLGVVLQRSHARLPVQKILVMKFQGLGSMAIALPALKELRRTFPNAQIDFWGTSATVNLARRTKLFDHFFTLEDSDFFSVTTSLLKNFFSLIMTKYDWAFDLEVYSKLSSLLLTLTCARNRAGFAIESASIRRRTHTHLILFNRYSYVGEAITRLFSLCCEKPLKIDDLGKFEFNTAAANEESPPHDRPVIVINANVGELAKVRAWPESKFSELISVLSDRLPEFQIVLIGKGADEFQTCANLANQPFRNANVQNLANTLSLDALIELITRARLIVTADTSILHLASLTLTPTVVLFGPTLEATYLRPAKGWKKRSISTSLYCRPCVHHWPVPLCGGNNICMKEISVAEVGRAAFELLDVGDWPQTTETKVSNPETMHDGFVAGLIFRRPQ